jgi:hypothetical protein
MKRRLTATGVDSKKSGLTVYVTVEVGTTIRFVAVVVPWTMLAAQHEHIVNEFERIYTAQLEADANVQYLPLETWE